MRRKKSTQPWTPGKGAIFEESEEFSNRMNAFHERVRQHAFELFQNRPTGSRLGDWLLAEREVSGACPIELTEANGSLVVRAEVPGYSADEIKIHVEPERISINGEHRAEDLVPKDERVVYTERCGTFLRTLPLPGGVKPKESQAQLKDGILEIVLVKNDGEKLSAKKP